MIVFAALTRLLPHPPNFAAVSAMALFAGAQIGDRRLSLLVPLAAMFLTDLVLGLHSDMLPVYVCMGAMVFLGAAIGPQGSPIRIAAASLAGSVLFFLVTNFSVWATGSIYPQSLAGLGACYVAALPFFQNTVVGDLFYTAALFGGFEFLRRAIPALSMQNIEATGRRG
jgi:hypothetical protein